MAHLLDTNVLARLASAGDPRYAVATQAVSTLHRRGEVLYITPQNLIEFRALATRPVAANGLGLPAVDAEAKAADFEAQFSLLPDVPAIYPAWKFVVETLGVMGRQVYDARLVRQLHPSDRVRAAGRGRRSGDRLIRSSRRIAAVHPQQHQPVVPQFANRKRPPSEPPTSLPQPEGSADSLHGSVARHQGQARQEVAPQTLENGLQGS